MHDVKPDLTRKQVWHLYKPALSICSIEDIAAHTRAPFWMQLYVMKDRDFIERLIDRAKAARCSALVLTLDLQSLGQRHKD